MLTQFPEPAIEKEKILPNSVGLEKELWSVIKTIKNTQILITNLEQKPRTKTKRANLAKEIKKLEIRKLQLEVLLDETLLAQQGDPAQAMMHAQIDIQESKVADKDVIHIPIKIVKPKEVKQEIVYKGWKKFFYTCLHFFTHFAVKKSTLLK